MGIDTYFYLIDGGLYFDKVVPALDRLIDGSDTATAREMLIEACERLEEAAPKWPSPLDPIHSTDLDRAKQDALALIDGGVPRTYSGLRGREVEDPLGLDPDYVVNDPQLAREYWMRDCVCGLIIEGLCVPWQLDFPPVHNLMPIRHLYARSKLFENVVCGEIHGSPEPPYEILHRDQLVDEEIIEKLAAEIVRIAPPNSELWQIDYYRNLYLLLQHAANTPRFRVIAVYL